MVCGFRCMVLGRRCHSGVGGLRLAVRRTVVKI
jgi:hypothetical protein